MSDLQDALAETIVNAARRVANPDYEAALSVYDARSEDHPDEVSYVRAIVDAALGITTKDISLSKCRHGFTNMHVGANGEWACVGPAALGVTTKDDG